MCLFYLGDMCFFKVVDNCIVFLFYLKNVIVVFYSGVNIIYVNCVIKVVIKIV